MLSFLPKAASHFLYYFLYKPARSKLRRQSSSLQRNKSRSFPSVAKCSLQSRSGHSIVSDFHGTILRSSSYFPHFMLFAFEGGGLLRALFLLLSYPFLVVMNEETSIKVMVFITFCGLRKKDVEIVSKAVMPKFYLEDLNYYSCRVLGSFGRKVVVTRMPKIMAERFLKEYLEVEEVVGSELHMIGGLFFTGFTSSNEKVKTVKGMFMEEKADVGLVGYCNPHNRLLIPYCKEAYMVTGETITPMPRNKYPKPLIFHDGRLAFLPTPLSSLFLFLYIPIGITLAIIRITIAIILPYKLSRAIAPFIGFKLVALNTPKHTRTDRVLYVCNHRTLLDPLMLTGALLRPLTAVTYSLSPFSEFLSPIKTARLTRDRSTDSKMIKNLLTHSDVVVCPEGTTCREPYLLRFSALFAELADNMEPVAMEAVSSMFYGTTASGFKFLDPIFFLMNPRPEYRVKFLGRVPPELTCSGGKLTAMEVANRIQREIGDALEFECTSLTRKDKYLLLAGNEGVVGNR